MYKYIVEKNNTMPLCAVIDNIYFNYLDGQVIDNKNALKFIENGLKSKSLKIVDMDLVIYEIKEYENIEVATYGYSRNFNSDAYDWLVRAYDYQINGCSNYLDINKQPLNKSSRQYIIDKLMNGEYIQEKIWGDTND